MAVTIQTRRDESGDWTIANPVLALGEIGIETDTDKAKYGDGFTAWNDLAYWIDPNDTGEIPDGTADGQVLRWEDGTTEWQATSSLVIGDVGNVAIGTDFTTGARLRVSNNGEQGLEIFPDAAGGEVLLQGFDRLAGEYTPITMTANFLKYNTGTLAGGIDERMRIDSAGNVGIGESNPLAKLHINGNLRIDHTDQFAIRFIRSASTTGYIGGITGGGLEFAAPAGTSWARIDSSGNVLVGNTTAPASGNGGIQLGAPVSGNRGILQQGKQTGVTGLERIQQYYYGTTEVGHIDISSTATAYVTSSDERMKENIAPAGDALPTVMQMLVRQFDWRDGNEHRDFGFIAQELVDTCPDAVSVGDDECMWGTDNSHLVPVLVKAIQELTARVETLENA